MAATPAFRAAGTIAATANNVANPSTLAPALPTRSTADTLLCVTTSRSNSATVATPSGWTLVSGFPRRATLASGGTVYLFARAVDGAETAPSLVWTGLTTGTSGDSAQAYVLSYSGLKLTGVVDGAAATGTDSAVATTPIVVPSVTTTLPNTLILSVAIRINDTSHIFSGGRTNERIDSHTTSGTGHGLQVTDVVLGTAGAAGSANVVPSATVASPALGVTVGLAAADTFQPSIGDTVVATDNLVSSERGSRVVQDDLVVVDDLVASERNIAQVADDLVLVDDLVASQRDIAQLADDIAVASDIISIGVSEALFDALPLFDVRSNLIANPSIETDASGWVNQVGDETFARSTEEALVGTASLKIIAPSGGRGARTTYPVVAGHTYRISAYIKSAADVSGWIRLLAGTYAPPYDAGMYGAAFVVPDGTWQRLTFLHTPSATRTDTLVVTNEGPSSATIYVDKVSVIEVSESNTDPGYWEGDTGLSAQRGVSSSLTDTLTVVDSQITSSATATTIADALGLTDAQALDFSRALADALTVADAQNSARGIQQALASTLTVADALTAASAFATGPADTLTVADSVALAYMEAIADVLGVADAQAFDFVRALGDTLTLNDAVALALAFQASVADTATVADALAVSFAFAASPSDALTMADSVALTYMEAIADALGVTDAQAFDFARSLGDALTLNDALALAFQVNATDTATIADSVTPASQINTTAADAASVADSIAAVRALESALADSLVLADTISKFVVIAPADTLTVTDAQSFDRSVTVADAITTTFPALPGRVERFRAADLAAVGNGNRISSWPANIGSLTLTPFGATGPTYRAAGIGGKPGIELDAATGGSQVMRAAIAPSLPKPFTMMSVHAITQYKNYGQIWTANQGNTNGFHTDASGQHYIFDGAVRTINPPVNGSLATHVVITEFDLTETRVYVDGALVQTLAQSSTGVNGLSIGGTYDGNNFGVEIIGEVVYIDSILAPATRQQLLDYGRYEYQGVGGLSDSTTPSKGWGQPLADSLILTDVASTTSAFQSSLADNVTVADATSLAQAIAQAVADAGGLADSLSFQRAIDQSLTDAISVTDSASGSIFKSANISDVLVLSDALSKDAQKVIADILGVADLTIPILSGSYIHHVPPLSGDYGNTTSGLVIAVVADGTVTVIDASGVVVTVNAAGEILDATATGDPDAAVSAGAVLDVSDTGVGV